MQPFILPRKTNVVAFILQAKIGFNLPAIPSNIASVAVAIGVFAWFILTAKPDSVAIDQLELE